MTRTPMKRTRLRPVSAKRRKQQPARKRCLDAVKLRSGGMCEFPSFPWCPRPGVDGHEMLRRSQGGSATDPSNVLWLCRKHHDEIHANPTWAYQVGLLLRKAVSP